MPRLPTSVGPPTANRQPPTASRQPLPPDLDAVVLKALAAAPAQRCASADAMAAEVAAVLRGRSVSARPSHPACVLGKLLRRHPAASAAVVPGIVGTVFGLAAALGIALREARRSATARRVAEGQAADLRRLSREIVVGFGEVVRHLPAPGLVAGLAVAHAQVSQLRSAHDFNARVDTAAVQRHAARVIELAERVAPQADAAPHLAWAGALRDLSREAQDRSALDESARRLDESDAVLERALVRWRGDAAAQYRALAQDTGFAHDVFEVGTAINHRPHACLRRGCARCQIRWPCSGIRRDRWRRPGQGFRMPCPRCGGRGRRPGHRPPDGRAGASSTPGPRLR